MGDSLDGSSDAPTRTVTLDAFYMGKYEVTKGEWDEVRVLGCCTFMALRGDSLVEIDFGGSAATPEQAGTLADAALRRLEAPLPIDGRDGIAAAEQRQSLRPKAGDPCLWNAADIEATVGILQGTPQASDSSAVMG